MSQVSLRRGKSIPGIAIFPILIPLLLLCPQNNLSVEIDEKNFGWLINSDQSL
jgi:hypothetical protein